MNASLSPLGESPIGSSRPDSLESLESLESRLWERARRNLRLLYNGGHPPSPAAEDAKDVIGPLLVVNPKL